MIHIVSVPLLILVLLLQNDKVEELLETIESLIVLSSRYSSALDVCFFYSILTATLWSGS